MLETVTRVDSAPLEAPALAPHCPQCGTLAAPDGACFELGSCSRADSLATRGAARATVKSGAAPAAWNGRGRVD